MYVFIFNSTRAVQKWMRYWKTVEKYSSCPDKCSQRTLTKLCWFLGHKELFMCLHLQELHGSVNTWEMSLAGISGNLKDGCQLTVLLNPGQCMTLLSMCCSIGLYTKHSARHGCAASNDLQSCMLQKLWGLAGLLVPEPLIWLFLNAYLCCLWNCWNVTTKASWKGDDAVWSR